MATATNVLFGDEQRAVQELNIARDNMTRDPYVVPKPDGKTDNRLQKAYELVMAGAVKPVPGGGYEVRGSKGVVYTVAPRYGDDPASGLCSCDAAQKGHSRYCYHWVATHLYQNWQARLGESIHPTPLPQATHTTTQKPAEERVSPMDTISESSNAVDAPERLPEAKNGTGEHAPLLAPREARTRYQCPLCGAAAWEGEIFAHRRFCGGHAANVAPPPRPSIETIVRHLSRPLPEGCLGKKSQGGADVLFVPHYVVAALLDHYAPGWQTEIVRMESGGKEGVVRVFLKLGLPCAEGMVWREDVGESDDWDSAPKQYGNPSANAKAAALRRCAAQFGLGRWLYDGFGHLAAVRQLLNNDREQKTAALAVLGTALDARHLDRQAFVQRLKETVGVEKNLDLPLDLLKAAVALVEGQ